MARIYSSESNISVEFVGFNDIDTIIGKNESFFVTKAPCSHEPEKKEPGGEAVEKTASGSAGGENKKAAGSRKPAGGGKGANAGKPPDYRENPDIEAIRQEAYAKGKKDGRAEADKKLHTTVGSLAQAVEEISRLRDSLFEKSRQDMVRLVMAIAAQVIRTEIRENENVIVRTVAAALEAAVPAEEYYIRVNPADLAAVTENQPLFLASMKGLQNIHVTADEAVSRGGAVAEARTGDIDATIESQLEGIYEHLRREITGLSGDEAGDEAGEKAPGEAAAGTEAQSGGSTGGSNG